MTEQEAYTLAQNYIDGLAPEENVLHEAWSCHRYYIFDFIPHSEMALNQEDLLNSTKPAADDLAGQLEATQQELEETREELAAVQEQMAQMQEELQALLTDPKQARKDFAKNAEPAAEENASDEGTVLATNNGYTCVSYGNYGPVLVEKETGECAAHELSDPKGVTHYRELLAHSELIPVSQFH